MKKRKLGNSGMEVSPVTLGGNVFGWTIDKEESFRILDSFMDAGFEFIDTADSYSWWVPGHDGGESERIIGEWMKTRNNRDKVIISTKVGSQTRERPKNISRGHILKAVEGSLKRLNTDYIDLYQTHFDDEVTPVEETLAAYDQLIMEGKVRAIGVSNMSVERILESLKLAEEGLPKYETLQPLYNLMEREAFEKELLDLAEENEMGVISYYSLASGFLTGKYRSEADLNKSVRGEGVRKYLNEKGMQVLKVLDQIAENHQTTPATVSLAWLLSKPTIKAPIVSATNEKQLASIIEATRLRLELEDLERLNVVSEWRRE